MASGRRSTWLGRRLASAGFERIAGQASGLLRHALAALMLGSVAACAVGPDFAAPPAPAAASWLEWRNKSLKTGDNEYRDWWRVFHDLVLDRLIVLAYEQNLTLLGAGTRVLQARALLGIAIGEFYPQQQQGVGAVTYNLRSRSNPTVLPSTASANFWLASLGINAAWEPSFAVASSRPMPIISPRLQPMTMSS